MLFMSLITYISSLTVLPWSIATSTRMAYSRFDCSYANFSACSSRFWLSYRSMGATSSD